MITIGTVKFDFKASNEPFAQDLYKRWNYFFETNFEKVLSDVLCFYDRENEMIIIESLPIDLGVLQEEDFDRQFAEKLRQALLDYLKEYLDGRNESQDAVSGIRRITIGQSALETLSFYLLHGYFPYQTEAEFTNPGYLLELVLSTESYRFREFLETYGHYGFLYQRMAFQFTDEELEKIVCVIRPSESKFANLYARVQINSQKGQIIEILADNRLYHRLFLDESHTQGVLEGKAGGAFRMLKWEFMFACLLGGNKSVSQYKNWVYSVLYQLAARYNQKVLDLLCYFFKEQAAIMTALPFPALKLALKELYEENTLPLMKPDVVRERAGLATFVENPPDREMDTVINELKKEGVIMETVRDEYSVKNAGFILCTPFFPRLFLMAGLLKDDRRSFKDESSRVRAVFMLQYLAYGIEQEWQESALLLNKLFVGFELEQPLPRKVDLLDEEKKITDELVKTICTLWDKLKNVSAQGMRMSFLQREGIVSKGERPGFWMLKVEEKAYDMLLDSIPWNFRLFKTPWENIFIETKWRG